MRMSMNATLLSSFFALICGMATRIRFFYVLFFFIMSLSIAVDIYSYIKKPAKTIINNRSSQHNINDRVSNINGENEQDNGVLLRIMNDNNQLSPKTTDESTIVSQEVTFFFP